MILWSIGPEERGLVVSLRDQFDRLAVTVPECVPI